MRRTCALLSFVALCAATLAVATAAPTPRHGTTRATAATTPAQAAVLADFVRRGRSDARTGFRPEVGVQSTEFAGPVIVSPHPRQDRTYRGVLLDGSDRWRSLLRGAPPLFA